MQMWCIKCRKKVIAVKVQGVMMKNGKPATKGKCPNCGTGCYKIGCGHLRVVDTPNRVASECLDCGLYVVEGQVCETPPKDQRLLKYLKDQEEAGLI